MMQDSAVLSEATTTERHRIGDYLELSKPRIALLVLFTVASGGIIASGSSADLPRLALAVLGTALVATGATVLNQLHEIDTDSIMERTARRPLPTGRIAEWEAALFGYGSAIAGSSLLAWGVNLLSAGLALASFILYVFAYTPLKRVTSLNTVVGAIPGALPPLIGYAAMRDSLDMEAAWLFLMLFVWQFPHFFAIAWLYRDDYASAGIRMLPTTRLGRRTTALQMVSFCLILLIVTIAPVMLGEAGNLLLVGSVLLGLQFLGFCVAFLLDQTRSRARLALISSLIYLPMLLVMWMLDSIRTGV